MTPFRIFVDMDGVIVNCTKKLMEELTDRDYNDPEIRDSMKGLKPVAFEKSLNISEKEVWKRIHDASADVWAEMEEYEWTQRLWKGLENVTENVCILSSPGRTPSFLCEGKHKWVLEHLKTDNFQFCVEKHFSAGPHSVLIDDTPKKCENFRKWGGKAVLFPNDIEMLDGDYPIEVDYGHVKRWYPNTKALIDGIINQIQEWYDEYSD